MIRGSSVSAHLLRIPLTILPYLNCVLNAQLPSARVRTVVRRCSLSCSSLGDSVSMLVWMTRFPYAGPRRVILQQPTTRVSHTLLHYPHGTPVCGTPERQGLQRAQASRSPLLRKRLVRRGLRDRAAHRAEQRRRSPAPRNRDGALRARGSHRPRHIRVVARDHQEQ